MLEQLKESLEAWSAALDAAEKAVADEVTPELLTDTMVKFAVTSSRMSCVIWSIAADMMAGLKAQATE